MLTLKELVELTGEHARRVMVEGGSDLMPTWLLFDYKGKMFMVNTPWRDEAEKEIIKRAMHQYVRKYKIVAYGFVTEAWMATKPRDWTPESDPHYLPPSKDPERREVVIAMATDGNRQEFRTWAIRRDYNERVSALELSEEAGVPVLGWMTELLAK